jgi:hypothetical protein
LQRAFGEIIFALQYSGAKIVNNNELEGDFG